MKANSTQREALECGDLSPLLRRRLVAVGVPQSTEFKRLLHRWREPRGSLANPPAHFRSTATSRLEKAVTSHRTPKARAGFVREFFARSFAMQKRDDLRSPRFNNAFAAFAAAAFFAFTNLDRKSTRLNSSHSQQSRMPSSA